MVGGRVCKYMRANDARAIHNALTQGRTVQKGGSNPPNPTANHTLRLCMYNVYTGTLRL